MPLAHHLLVLEASVQLLLLALQLLVLLEQSHQHQQQAQDCLELLRHSRRQAHLEVLVRQVPQHLVQQAVLLHLEVGLK